MAEPLRIRFATDTSGVKSAMQDMAATVVSNMVKVSSTVASNSEVAGAAATKLGQHFGTGARGVATAATTIVKDVGAIGAAGIKAANDTGVSAVAIGAAMGKAAAETTTASAVGQAAMAGLGAKASFTLAMIRREVGQTASLLLASPLFRTAAVGVAAFVGVTLAINAIEAAARFAAEQVERLVKIGDRATSAGVSAGFLQSMESQADKLKLKLEDIQRIFERLRKDSTLKLGDAGEPNQSPLEKRLRELQGMGNLSKADVNGIIGAPDAEARFKALLELMNRLIDSGKVLTALEIGERFLPESVVDRIRQNRVELENLIKAANSPKQDIFTDEEIARSAELSRRMREAQETLSNGLKPIYEDLARRGREFHESNVQWVEFLAARVPQIISLYRTIAREIQNASNAAASAVSGKVNPTDGSATGAVIGAAIGKGNPQETLRAPTDLEAAKEWLRKNMNPSMIDLQQKRGQAIIEALNPPKDNPPPGKKSGGSSASESLDQVESYIESLERSTAAIKAEVEAYGKSNEEKQKAIALARGEELAKQRGSALTEEETRKLTDAAAAAGAARDKLALLQQQTQLTAEAFRALGDAAVDSLYDMIVEGKSAGEVMQNLTKILIKAALQSAIMGTGPLAGLFGTAGAPGGQGGLIGLLQAGFKALPGFADGTDWAPGGLAMVGERGPELVRLPRASQVYPNARLPSLMGGGSPSINVHLGDTVIDARGADPGVEARLYAGLDQRERAMREGLALQFRDIRGRGALR